MNENSQRILAGVTTAFLDHATDSMQPYRPQFISNNYKEGCKVIATIEKELKECEEFIFCVAFICESGLTPLLSTLQELEHTGIRGKILTTDYLEFSEPSALKKLHAFRNIEIKLYKTAKGIGFHTKGYFFLKKDTHTFLIGSSNLTLGAITRNKEWNTRLVSMKDGEFSQRVLAEFYTFWNSPQALSFEDFYENYLATYQHAKARREAAKRLPSPLGESKEDNEKDITPSSLSPNAMQQMFIQELAKIRNSGEDRALLISATGTGKTYAAAFAVREFAPKRMLFIVHRETICKAAQKSFRRIFGKEKSTGLISGEHKDFEADFIFATMSSMAQDHVRKKFTDDAFDFIVIDEAHRAGAKSYRAIMNHFKPKFWLGMTASPDRTDGFDIYKLFNHNIAGEIRLQQAMEEDLLCPFQYFGISDLEIDGTDAAEHSLRDFAKLTSTTRVKYVINNAQFYGYSGECVRGLIFCSSIDEAKELSFQFNQHGYKTVALCSQNSQDERDDAIEQLSLPKDDPNRIDYIFSVDLFNEGVDIPDVNQVIMLRPTQSNIVFIQQLGRGLRKHEGKEYVVVLDFIGNYTNNFMIPQALSGDTSGKKDELRRFAMEGTKVLPGSSTIHFDKIARERIFSSIDKAKLNSVSEIKKSYKQLKHKINRIPALMDFDTFGALDPLLMFDVLGSYYAFLSKYEPNYPYRFTAEQETFLKYVSCKWAAGKRPHELEALKLLMSGTTSLFAELCDVLHQQYIIELSNNCQENLTNIFTGQFLQGEGANAYTSTIFIKKTDEGDYTISDEFAKALASAPFRAQLQEVIDFGLSRYAQYYHDTYQDTSFVLYRQYSYADVCRLSNWKKEVVAQNIGGYKYDDSTRTYPVFINYEKGDDIAASINYQDEFINESYLKHLSKSKRTKESPDVKKALDSESLGIRIDLFVRKNKVDKARKEFYYLGRMRPSSLPHHAPQLVRMPGTNTTAVETVYKLDTPVRADIFDYLTSTLTNVKTIEVVAAVIIRNQKVFASQRGYGEFKDGWEFPGGKIEPGETPQVALQREIKEELNTDISVGDLIKTIEYDYPNFHLTMHCFQCTLKTGKLELLEHEAAAWVTRSDIDALAWLPADLEVLAEVKALLV